MYNYAKIFPIIWKKGFTMENLNFAAQSFYFHGSFHHP